MSGQPGRPPIGDADRVASPCISVCRIDDASGLCVACLRTLDEIAAWSVLDDDDKRAVLAALPVRRAKMGSHSNYSEYRSDANAGAK